MPPKRRRRFHGLYYHSSPPKVMPMNGQANGQNGRKRRENEDFSVKLSTIRIWMHEKDIGKLTRILWAGQGQRLCQQASNNGRVKRFLAAVPHVMNATKDLHQSVIDNNLETLQLQLEPPVPTAMVTAKDNNGLSIIHKAAGLGHTKILEYLIGLWPEGIHEIDITGKTPLHWAASAKNNMRCYTLLTQAGCDEAAEDYKGRTPSYYRHKPHEIERAFLVYVPEAPRISPDSVTDWEALSDDTDSNAGGDASNSSSKLGKLLDIKPAAAINGRKSLDDSAENTSEFDTNDGVSVNEDDDLSKAEVEAEPEPEVETLPPQRRPETPAAFLANDTNGDTESESENIARAVSDDDADANKIEPEEGEGDTKGEEEVEQQAEDVTAEATKENGDLDVESEQNATEKTEAIENGNDVAEDNDIPNEANTETIEHDEEPVEIAEAAKEDEEEVELSEDKEEEKPTTAVAVAAVAAEEEDVEEDDDEDVIASTPTSKQKQVVQPEQQTEQEQEQVQDNDGGDSLTSALAIEGFVQGDAEDYTVQSQTAAYEVDEDTRLQQIIESGDMEQLAEIVLNGEGGKLMGLKSKESEIQAFLNNVPSYMEKIHRVHDAARDGSLLALQQALDRRKFAIAKDDISPNGATPLHVAVLFGHSDIVRYLASRFPETMAITDNDGRTALHYAATIKDNGHFYNVLSQLGANTKALDKLGHTPEFYVDTESSKDVLTYTELLSLFGAEELENQLLSDQGQSQPVTFQANPIFKTEQGKYLADSLADPLIKALTEIANKRPKDPVAYLTGYLQQFMGQRKAITEVVVHSGSSSKTSTNSTARASSNSKAASSRLGKNRADIIEMDARSLAEEHEDDDEDGALAVQHLEERDEHGQSMLHFACARSHRRGALYTLIEESRIDITYRDELYRTARDVALQANQPNNAAEIDRYVLAQAVLGDVEAFELLALQGYDHILDVEDESGKTVLDVATERQHEALIEFLNNLRTLEEAREELHQMIRDKNMDRLKELTAVPNAKWLIRTKNYYGRTALHIAALKESEDMVQHLVELCPEALKVTDNLERTVLHYALGTNFCESVSRILIQNGAKRTAKDLKGRQPSYYFINKADILRLQEEEEESR